MRLRFYNGKVLTMEPGKEIQETELWTLDDKIEYIGPGRDDAPQFDRSIDLNGNILIPGFKNAHSHSAMVFLRSFADDLPLKEWLFDRVFPYEDKVNDDDVYWFTKLAILEYLSGGITSCFDMYKCMEGFTAACIESGFRAVLCGNANDFGGTAASTEMEFKKYNNLNPLLSYKMGFHAEYTTSSELMSDLSDLVNKYKQPLFVHNSETKPEVLECIQRHNMTPTEIMNNLGLFNYGGGGFHCVYLSENDKKIFKEQKMYIITNPGSNTKLASGIAPIDEYYSFGIPMGIGTDGAASNNALNMFREMYLATGLTKQLKHDPKAMSADKILNMAMTGSAHAMGLDYCDSLKPGKQADIVEINMHMPNMQPEHNIIKNIVYSGSNNNIKRTIIAGKILFEDNNFNIGEEPDIIYEKCKAANKRIFS